MWSFKAPRSQRFAGGVGVAVGLAVAPTVDCLAAVGSTSKSEPSAFRPSIGQLQSGVGCAACHSRMCGRDRAQSSRLEVLERLDELLLAVHHGAVHRDRFADRLATEDEDLGGSRGGNPALASAAIVIVSPCPNTAS